MRFKYADLTPNQFWDIYEMVFGYKDTALYPPVIVLARNDKMELIGFLAGYYHDQNTFYIQATGVLPKYRNKAMPRFFKGIMDYVLGETNIKYIICLINADDNHVLRIVLKDQFHIMGVRQTTKKRLLVELIKERSDDNL